MFFTAIFSLPPMSVRQPYCGHMEHNLRCIQKLSKNKSSNSLEHKFVETSLRSSNDVSAGFPWEVFIHAVYMHTYLYDVFFLKVKNNHPSKFSNLSNWKEEA